MFHFGTRDTVFLLEMVPFHDLDHFSAHFSVLELEYRFIFTIVTRTVAKKVCSCAPKNNRYTMESPRALKIILKKITKLNFKIIEYNYFLYVIILRWQHGEAVLHAVLHNW